MPNIKSSVQDVKSTAIRNARNKSVKSEVKTAIKKLETILAEAKGEEAQEAFKTFVSTIDKAVSKGVIHKSTAARKKSRLAVRLAAAQ